MLIAGNGQARQPIVEAAATVPTLDTEASTLLFYVTGPVRKRLSPKYFAI
jgi:hypothetical protein